MKEHNLKIQVFSEGEVGRGTHFYIDFPRMLPPSEPTVMNVLSHTATDQGMIKNSNTLSIFMWWVRSRVTSCMHSMLFNLAMWTMPKL
jgi:hypothetical protein